MRHELGRTLARALVIVALLSGACTVSSGSGDRREVARDGVDARVTGVVVGVDGAPAGDVPILVRATDTGLGPVAGAFAGLLTLGVACISGICSSRDDVVAETTTAPDGSYGATLPGAYVAGTETDTDWIVSALLPAGDGQLAGATSAFEFEVNIDLQDAPPLPVWTQDPTVTVDGWGVTVDATGSVPPGLGPPSVALASSYGEVRLPGPAGTLDLRLLETPAGQVTDVGAHASAATDVRVPHANGRTIYHQRTTSAVVDVPVDPIPASRGVACTARQGDGTAVALGAGCPLTDGRFEGTLSAIRRSQARAAAEDGGGDPDGPSTTVPAPPPITAATVDLLSPIDISLVVLRGGRLGQLIEGSVDGEAWTALSPVRDDRSAQGELVVATPDGPLQARYVRVSHPEGIDLAEVSVWEPRPGMRPTPAISDPQPGGDGSVGGEPPDDDGGDQTVAGWAAAVLLAALWLALGHWVVAGRHRVTEPHTRRRRP